MAKHNPFNVFRRNQRAWLAGLTIFTMFSFIVLGNMFQCVQQRHPAGSAGDLIYAKSTKFGNLDHLAYMTHRESLSRLQAFLEAATQKLMMEREIISYANMLLVVDKDPNDPTKQTPILLDQLMALMMENSFTLSDGRKIADHWLITQTAVGQGYKVNEDSVREFLEMLFQNRLMQEDFDYALRQSGLSFGHLLEICEKLIINDRLYRAVSGGRRWTSMSDSPLPFGQANILTAPGNSLDALDRLYRKYRVAVAAFPVDRFTDQVAEPSEETLKKFYEQYQYVTYDPSSKTPGFTMPTKMAFEVIRGKVTTERIDAIPESEVRDWYNLNRESFKKPDSMRSESDKTQQTLSELLSLPGDSNSFLPIPDSILSEIDIQEVQLLEEPKTETPQSEESQIEEALMGEPKAEELPTDNQENLITEEAQNNSDTSAEEQLSEQQQAEETQIEEATEAQAEETNKLQDEEMVAPQSLNLNESPFRLVSYQAELVNTEIGSELATNATDLATDDEYFAFEEVEQGIRSQLAAEKLQAELDEIYTQMEAYSKALANRRAGVSKKVDLPELNLAQIAASSGFDFAANIETVSIEDASIMEILPDAVLEEKFTSAPLEYAPEKTGMIVDTVYLFWATKVRSTYQPTFEEAKVTVLQEWKKQEAVKIAKQYALDFAKKVAEQKKPIAEVAALETTPIQCAETQKFSWFDFPRGFRSAELTLGEIREEGVSYGEAQKKNKVIVAPGDEFYSTVAGLSIGETAVAMNQPETSAYLVELLDKDTDETITDKISSLASDPFARQAEVASIRRMNIQFQEDWIEELRKEAGFRWIIIPRDMR